MSITSKISRARQDYVCSRCEGYIKKGETYEYCIAKNRLYASDDGVSYGWESTPFYCHLDPECHLSVRCKAGDHEFKFFAADPNALFDEEDETRCVNCGILKPEI